MSVALVALAGLLQAALLGSLAYHYFLLLAGAARPPACRAAAPPRTRFAVAIPAHDEAPVLGATLARLAQQAYPRPLFDVHVVADHCTDATAEVAAAAGAGVQVREEPPGGSKAHALRWLLARLLGEGDGYDAVAIFDADSLVDPGFLGAMDCHLRAGARALQGQHLIANPGDGLFAALAAVDMRLNNRLRNQSRRNLGLSCRLMGDAMVLDARLLREVGWLGASMSEDREFGYELLLRGVRVRYVPEAKSEGQAAGGWRAARPQRLRWHRGVAAMRRRLAGRLLSAAWRWRSPSLLDAGVELLMPGYSAWVALAGLHLAAVGIAHAAGESRLGLMGPAGGALVLAAWLAYPLLGLLADRAPAWAFRAAALGPAYVGWRLWIALLVRVRGSRITWVRTRRREEAGN